MVIRIAIQGELGSFSHEAALRMLRPFGIEPELIACTLSSEVFEMLSPASGASPAAAAAVIPIENSLAGPVAEHYDLLLQHEVAIEMEMLLRIHHNLIGPPGMKLAEVEQVCSHPVALAQCRKFLAAHRHMKVVPHYDTAGSVREAVRQGRAEQQGRAGTGIKLAGIGSAQAAIEYGGEILAAGIQDNAENFTRFHLVCATRPGRAANLPRLPLPEPDKMSLAFTVPHRPGTLVAALELLAKCGVDLTRIDSRPVPGRPWEYVFFVDVRFSSPEVADLALGALKAHCQLVKELGRYRAA